MSVTVPPSRRIASLPSGVVAVAMVLTTVAALAFAAVVTGIHVGSSAAAGLVLDAMTVLLFAFVGAVIVWKRPGEIIGWLLTGCGVGLALTTAVIGYADVALGVVPGLYPADPRMVLIGNPLSTVAAGLGFVILPLLFPDGRSLSDGWRWVVRVAVAAMVAAAITGPFAEKRLRVWPADQAVDLGPNPFASWPGALILEGVAVTSFALMLLLAPVALASLVVRYRRGTETQRLQIRWVVSAAGAFVGALLVLLASEFVFGLSIPALAFDAVVGSMAALLPIAIGVAVLRYRLYDVGRVVRRTVSYAAVTVILIGGYAGSVVVLGGGLRALTGGARGDLVVAASTLGVAALFGPLRERVQRVVDRRFDRARYDAGMTVAAFGQRLRDEVDLEALCTELRGTASRTLVPAHASVVLMHGGES
jgi:hypothetical protein